MEATRVPDDTPAITPPEPIPPAAYVVERGFYRDPVWIMALGLFGWNFIDAWQGNWTWPEVRAAILSAGIVTARLAAPYVKSYIPWLDTANPSAGPSK